MQTNARQAAIEILEKCRRSRAWSGALLDNAVKKYDLDRRETALTTQLCLGVLQNMDLCDYYISTYCKTKLEPKVGDILRLGVYQILFLDKIPDRAAVNEAVELCKNFGYSRASGLVNAVLRKISDNKSSLPEIPGKGTAQYLSVKYSHPLWLAEYICSLYGYGFAEDFFKADNSVPKLTIQVNTLKISVEDYCRALENESISFSLSENVSGCIELDGGSAVSLPGFSDGHFYVQDKAARLAVAAAAPEPGMRVLDACSSPGGKTFASALLMHGKGSILACDIHEKKLRLVKEGAERLDFDIVKTEAGDARTYDSSLDGAFDVVIADVPCSGLGVIRKKPEIRLKTKDEIEALPVIQKEILDNLSKYVKPGGVLLYSTCTVIREENEAVVENFLERSSDFSAEAFSVGGIGSDTGMYTFWPHVDGTDGFFIAKLRRSV